MTEAYIWHAVQDGKARPEHAARDGKIFSWTNPPPGGHPGKDFGCRCWAENIKDEKVAKQATGLKQEVTSIVDEGLRKWHWDDFLVHFWTGDGKTVRLSEIQYLRDVISYAQSRIFPKVEAQVADLVRKQGEGNLSYTTERAYSFQSISYPIGDATLSSETTGTIGLVEGLYVVDAEVTYTFEDEFTDIFSIRERRTGTSSTSASDFEKDKWTEFGGTAYLILGDWKTKLTGSIAAKKS